MLQRIPRTFFYFLGAIFLLNVLQSHFMELIYDEAYYWYYSQEMAWGYFDHPPMVALMAKIGSWLFPGELGVRFVSCLFSVGTLWVLWQIIDQNKKNDYVPHFFVLAMSMVLLNAYGFFTLPDTPLLFFTAVFLWLYKRFLEGSSIWNTILLGLAMAALMYSKYHAVLVIFFVLLSNLKLVTDKRAWLAVGIALLCYTPHFFWLYQHDFVSVKYHLFERPNRAYEFGDFTLGFFVNLIALFGLTFPWIYKALFTTKSEDKFTKALLFLTYGVILFFFISSFQRRVQTQWLIVISIPMFVLAYRKILADEVLRKWLWRLGLVNIVILCYLRIGLIYEPLFPTVYESHGNREWTQNLASQVGETPVVFENSYRNAPMYAFYTGNTSFSLNNIMYRKNQYSIDDSEAEVQHKRVAYVSRYTKRDEISFTKLGGPEYRGFYIDNFISYRKLQAFLEHEPIRPDEQQPLTLKVYNPYPEDIPANTLRFGAAYLNRYKQRNEVLPMKAEIQQGTLVKAQDTAYFTIQLPLPKKEAPYYVKPVLSASPLLYGLNGNNVKLEID